MVVNEESQVKQTGSWEQIKCRLNENLFKRNDRCSASTSLSECSGISYSDDELKSHEALFKS